ncbi:DegT/DnrJ/EryC1/StrS family aminotransferase [Patescibacteria group bacterium]|nr:DegT/DnrJ/EryC1/StrS family aminotransferase [Patescibacteria group bacterium]
MKRINQIEPWIGKEEKEAMAEYLDSGGWLTEHKKTREFEQSIANYVGSRYASVVSNGTISLVIALMALDVGKEDEVIVPDYTMIASANAVVIAGAKPILVDIDPLNLCLDLELAIEAITSKTRAIMFVSINGRCPDMEKVVALANKYNLCLIEDAAQSLGSRYKGKHLGTFGRFGSFSFSVPKIITTGQGGALVTDDEELFSRVSKIKDFGRPKAGLDYHETMGLNAKFTDLQAVIGFEQMKKLDWRVKKKKEIYTLYYDRLQNIERIEFIDTNLEDCVPWFIDILANEAETRNNLAKFLDEKDIGVRPFYPAIHTQPPYSYIKGDFRNSESISQRGLWLPSSSFLTNEDIERVCDCIRSYFRNN